MSNHVEPSGRLGILVVRPLLPGAPRLFPAFGDSSRKARNATGGVQEIPIVPNYFAEITSVIRLALSRSDSRLREFPDLIAARDHEVVTIDCKDRMSSAETGRYAISRKCLTAGLQFLGANAPIPLYYVFGNLAVLTPAEVAHYGSVSQRGGSYYLVNGRLGHQFDDVFGTPIVRDIAA